MIKTTGIPKEKVLAALFNNAKTQGLGILHHRPNHTMTEFEAYNILRKTKNFDYLEGRVLKVDLSDDDGFEEWLYDRDNGQGAAQRAIDSIPGYGPTSEPEPQEQPQPPEEPEPVQTPENVPTPPDKPSK